MEKYDVLVVGASTTGCWFADQMAGKGFKVLVIEKQLPDDVSREYDIFHMGQADMEKTGLPVPEEGDPLREFAFKGQPMHSPYGTYHKKAGAATVIGMHKHDYIMHQAELAKQKGAEFIYGAPLTDLIFDDKGAVIGGKYKTDAGEQEVYAKIVADCSGIPSAARKRLPDTSCVDNLMLTPKNILYVVLYYIQFKDRTINPRELDGFYMQYKAWFAPAGKGYDGLYGVGGGYSCDYADASFKELYLKNVPTPEYDVLKVEKGMTPWHRVPYSFVDDGFIAMGDAAFLTKPTCGEGCTSSLVQGVIAVDVISGLLKADKPLTKENMWSINKRYADAQGIEFESLRPLLVGLLKMNLDEAEYLFEKDVIFSEKILGGIDDGIVLTPADTLVIAKGIIVGLLKGKLSLGSVITFLKGYLKSENIRKLYTNYPATYAEFPEWKKKAEKAWQGVGDVSDICDPELVKKLGIK